MAEPRRLLPLVGWIAALALAVAGLQRLDVQFDLTADGRHGLDPRLHALLAGLDAPVEAVGVWRRDRSYAGWIAGRLDDCRRAAPRLTLRQLDPLHDQVALEGLEQRLGRPAGEDVLYLLREGRPPWRIVLAGDLARSLQRELGAGLLALDRAAATPLWVLAGHGEIAGDGPDGLSALLDVLHLRGFAARTLDETALSRLGRVPDDGVLLVAGPTAPLGDAATRAIETYLRDGGAALVLADHRAPADLVNLLERWAVMVGGRPGDETAGRVVAHSLDRALRVAERRLDLLAVDTGRGRGDDALRSRLLPAAAGRPAVLPATAPVWAPDFQRAGPEITARFHTQGGLAPETEAVTLGLPGDDAWLAPFGETKVPAGKTTSGDLPLARAGDYPPHPQRSQGQRRARLVVWGSREAATSRWVADPRWANGDLLAEAAGWLAGRDAEAAIPPTDHRAWTIAASPTTVSVITGLLTALLPSLLIGLAILAWRANRRG